MLLPSTCISSDHYCSEEVSAHTKYSRIAERYWSGGISDILYDPLAAIYARISDGHLRKHIYNWHSSAYMEPSGF